MLTINIFTNNKVYFVITQILHGASENHPAERSSCLVIEYTLHLLYVYVSNWFSGMDEVVRCSCGPALRLSHAAICLRVAVACSVQWRRLGVRIDRNYVIFFVIQHAIIRCIFIPKVILECTSINKKVIDGLKVMIGHTVSTLGIGEVYTFVLFYNRLCKKVEAHTLVITIWSDWMV